MRRKLLLGFTMKSSIDLLSLCNNSLVYYVGSIVFGNIEYFQSANTTPG